MTAQSEALPADIVAATEAMSSILPLCHFIAATGTVQEQQPVDTNNVIPQVEEPRKPKAQLIARDQLRPKADQVFILRDRATSGKKRKADEADADEDRDEPMVLNTNSTAELSFLNGPSVHSSQQTSDANPEYESARVAKKQKKAEKKAEKKGRKAAEKVAAEAAAQEVQPFDYASAPSLLASADGGGGGRDDAKTGGTKAMNPFAKALDTSTGARRSKMGKELAGKSVTFKS